MERKQAGASMRATGTYELKGWDEKTWDGKDWKEQSGAKLTHVKSELLFHGGIDGQANVQFLMAYRDDSFASFVGLQQITGKIGDRAGSFVVQVDGVFENGAATSTWTVVPGSGTGDLQGLKGEGSSVARQEDQQPYTLDYSFE